ncbi:hypothetical protein LUZ63_016141 [Rhynchospora breviuscula]|uniref:Cysteine-rich receptor-like protein kinase 10 n=1 Tax=Rhynchospora breviuscula TaxID=2022672 RepID=A0A9Q0CDN5_9POAL|nr:hypothetical protein LUZ63_016141 [Rhynchospora breviuscula]
MFLLLKGAIRVQLGQLHYEGLVECTKDLSQYDCGSCIESALENLSGCSRSTRARGARISFMSCYIRYELYPFPLLTFKPLAPVPGPLPPKLLRPFNEGSKTKHVGVAAICAPGFFLFIVAAVVCFGKMRKTKNIKTTSDKVASINGSKAVEETGLESTGVHGDCQVFLLSEIKSATDFFSDENKLGEGGFGPVYKGVLPNGEGIAVKRLAGWSKQGLFELKNEVVLLAKLNHKNLVKLLGYCVEEKEKLLCYEYLCNESLDKHLFESGLKIVHRDLKPSNILLDENMTPKISDFGLARLYNDDQTHKETSFIAGTYGYMAPEYAMHGMYSSKLDVYSFGVLLLEIVTGRKNSSFCQNQLAANLISYAWQYWAKGEVEALKDPALKDTCLEQMSRCIHIGLLCVQEDPINRPDMGVVNLMLTYNSITVPALSRFHNRTTFLPSEKIRTEAKNWKNDDIQNS